jgi:hypothetical protein
MEDRNGTNFGGNIGGNIVTNIGSNTEVTAGFGYDSLRGYDPQPSRECDYPHKMLLYTLDKHIFQQSVMKKNMNAYPGYIQKENPKHNFDPTQSISSVNNQRSLGKFDILSGGFNNQRELRGIVKDEKKTSSRNQNITMFSYGRF